MDLVRDFALREVTPRAAMPLQDFPHIANAELKEVLSDTLYGARWLYKLGLALFVQSPLINAHVRAQVIDYGAICEAILGDMVAQGIRLHGMRGDVYLSKLDPGGRIGATLDWTRDIEATLKKQNFFWLIRVARNEGMLDEDLKRRLDELRTHRNTVHLMEKARTDTNYVVNLSRRAFNTLLKTIEQTKAWQRDMNRRAARNRR
ncbi:MAG: hypothetical protein JST66_12575 [Bacteroidetes bacterium]|nr:hypothetical protein [Bacteroidota bacterium]